MYDASSGFGGLGQRDAEVLALDVEVRGQQTLTELEQQLAQTATNIQGLSAQLGSGAINSAKFSADTGKLVAQQDLLEKKIAATKHALANGSDSMVAATNRASIASNNFANGAFQVGYALDDVAYGWHALANNVPMVVQAIGGTGPLGASIAIAAAGATLLATSWEHVEAAMLAGIDTTGGAAQALREHSEELVRNRIEQERANDAKQRASEIDAILALKSEAEKSQESSVKKAFAEADPAQVRDSIVESMLKEGTGFVDRELEARYKGVLAQYGADHPMVQGYARRLEESSRVANLATAERMMTDATRTPEGLQALTNRVVRNPGVFPSGFAGDLVDSSAESKEQQALWERQGKIRASELAEQQREKKRADAEAERERKRVEREKSQADKETARFEEQAATEAERDREQAQRDRQKQIDDLARQYGTDQLTGELVPGILNRMTRGENEMAIEADAAKYVADRLVGAPGLPVGLEAEVGAAIAREAIKSQLPAVRDMGAQGAARQFQREEFTARQREQAEGQRAQMGMAEAAMIEAVQQQRPDLGWQQAQAVVAEIQRMQQAQMQMQAQAMTGWSGLAQTNAQMQSQLRRLHDQQRFARGNFHITR